MKNISTKIQQTTYGTHIYLICILCAHILRCHNCPYHILVCIQAGDMPTYKEKRLLECVQKARDEKKKAEEDCYSVKQKAIELKQLLVPGVEMCDDELEHLVQEIEDYKKSMKQTEKQMKSSMSAFMAAHSTTMEVFGVAGKVQYNQKFCSKGLRDIRCMFCTMVFDSHEVRKRHIISCHWTIFEATVSICYTCCKFSYGNVIATAYASASICGFFIYENMSLSGRCHIVHFCIL